MRGLIFFCCSILSTAVCLEEGVSIALGAREIIEHMKAQRYERIGYLLPGQLPVVPIALKAYAEQIAREGKERANALFIKEKSISVPEFFKPFASGRSDKQQQFKHLSIQNFVAALFEYIQKNALHTIVRLAPWDFYHGHLFVLFLGEPGSVDMGILFHSKEYPADMPFLPPGLKREDLPYRLTDPDFRLRNYLWLLSCNKVVLLDPSKKTFPKGLIEEGNKMYFTLDEKSFSPLIVGDFNYLPGLLGFRDPGKNLLVALF